MAGVAVNVGFYGLWRTLELLGRPPGWLAGTVLILAAITALLGISHAAVQTDLQRVVAYSSVENTGLILTGYGIALVGAVTHLPTLMAVGLLAGTLQVVAHTAAKSLLFTTSAQIETATGTNELDALGGTGRRLRWSGTGFAIGACTLAGLPPTAGFVSEWFLLEALMQQFRLDDLPFQLVLAISGAAIALTAGFAAVTFIRLVGMVVLGPGRPAAATPDYGVSGRVGIVLLGLGCLGIAAITPLEIRALAAGLSPIVPAAVTNGALKSPISRSCRRPGCGSRCPPCLPSASRSACSSPAGACFACDASPPGGRPPPAWKAPTNTPPPATATPPAGCWPTYCSPAAKCGSSNAVPVARTSATLPT
jgi:formate hydrogenlyase subunit 3/multisubunit Na+/H+ antiporter MnhD subunit